MHIIAFRRMCTLLANTDKLSTLSFGLDIQNCQYLLFWKKAFVAVSSHSSSQTSHPRRLEPKYLYSYRYLVNVKELARYTGYSARYQNQNILFTTRTKNVKVVYLVRCFWQSAKKEFDLLNIVSLATPLATQHQ